jgi:hypothetical protein
MADTVLLHPNRDKAESKATRAVVVLLLLVSALLILIVTLGGWSVLQGAQVVSFAFVVLYLVMAFFIWHWSRGLLPVSAAMAVLMTVFAAVAAPAWFERDKDGLVDPALEPALLGLLTIVLIPISLLLVVSALRGFQQQWNVEVELSADDAERQRGGDGGGRLQTA